jgi:hypothetical protein
MFGRIKRKYTRKRKPGQKYALPKRKSTKSISISKTPSRRKNTPHQIISPIMTPMNMKNMLIKKKDKKISSVLKKMQEIGDITEKMEKLEKLINKQVKKKIIPTDKINKLQELSVRKMILSRTL